MERTTERTYFGGGETGIDWEWNGREWTSYLERGNRAANFDGHIAYVRVDGSEVMKNWMPWRSNGIIGRISIGLSVLQCVHGFTPSCRVFVRLCSCVVVVLWIQNVHLLDAHVYIMLPQSNVYVPLIRDFYHEQLVLMALRQ